MHGSSTFQELVRNRDWEAVFAEMDNQVDRLHGVSVLTKEDREEIERKAAKDGFKKQD